MSEPSFEWLAERRREAFRVAHEIYRQRPNWVTFLREVLGEDGVVRRLFPGPEAFARFEKSGEYDQIQQMLSTLREQVEEPAVAREPTRVITVRLPKTLHELLRAEAHRKQTSMNKLCISKLLQVIEGASGQAEDGQAEDDQELFPDLPGLQDFGQPDLE